MVLTGRGAALLALGVVPLALTRSLWTLLAWAAACALVIWLDSRLAPDPARLRVSRARLAAVRLTQATETVLTVTNPGTRRLVGAIRDAWQPTAGAHPNRAALDLPPQESRRIRVPLTPTRRGHLHADRVWLRSRGPLGLGMRQVSTAVPGVLRVLPEFASRKHLPSRLARLREMDGRTAINVRGPGTEFDSLREYVLGDDVRAIDWRASARREDLVVRTWRPERDRRVVILLDTARLSAVRLGEAPRLDAGIEAALLLSALASHAGDRVDVVAMDQEVRAQVASGRGPAVIADVANALAEVRPVLLEPDWSLATRTVRARVSQRSLVVVVTAVEPAALDSGLVALAAALGRRHQVVVASATDPDAQSWLGGADEDRDVFDVAAAERAAAGRRGVARLLRGTGAEVLERDPEGLAPGLADTYLALKAAGRL